MTALELNSIRTSISQSGALSQTVEVKFNQEIRLVLCMTSEVDYDVNQREEDGKDGNSKR